MKVHDIGYKISLQRRKNSFFQNILRKCIGKPKDLWKAIKSFRLKVFIQTWYRIYWQNFQIRQIEIQLKLLLIITKSFII